jgi:pseudouridine-5'-phosphate glycosidase
VALETTLVTHGFPAPRGLAVARRMEETVRSHGAVPATVGVLRGELRVGLSAAELEALAVTPGARKLNLSNLAAWVAVGGTGSTTVAATLLISHRAGLRVFATGGIGGVHRGAERTDDVSSDLTALAGLPVAVVSAGAKAILELARTRERLETLGVPVFGYRTDDLPAFYRRHSGLPVDHRFDEPDGLARAVELHLHLGLGSGVLVANPIPVESELPAALYEPALAEALREAERTQVGGRDLTPFLLTRLEALTGGATLAANESLLLHDAAVAADLAVALAGLGRQP